MATDAAYAPAGRAARGFSVFCTEGALGEWFTVIPSSPSAAADLQRCGVMAKASLSAQQVREHLCRLGLLPPDVEALLASARASSTLITSLGAGPAWSPVALLRRFTRGLRDA